MPFILNDYVVPISLPTAQYGEWIEPDTIVRICGWGNTSVIGSSYPAELHCVDTKIIDVATCNQRVHYNGAVLLGMFCAGELNEGGKAACQGDSGMDKNI